MTPKMTPKEAIDRIDLIIDNEKLFIKISTMGEIDHSWNIETLEMAKQALEKTATKPVVLEADGYDDKGELIYDTAYCPNCYNKFDLGYDEETNCCPNCGQALDWAVSDEN